VAVTPTLAQAIKVLEERSEEDPALAEAVVFLAQEAEEPDDPFTTMPAGARLAARTVNERRLKARRDAAAVAALDTMQVVSLIPSINDRKGVDRRRQRGQLLAWRSGARMLHPDWQFDPRGGEVRAGLGTVIAALRQVTPDPRSADELMRASRDDLGGRSLVDLFATGRTETVVRLIRSSTDQA